MNPRRTTPALTPLLALLTLLCATLPTHAQKERGKPTVIEGMTSHHNLQYLPPDRYSGDEASLRGDYELVLDLHIPKEGKGPFPVVFYVHGGSWSGGTKEGQQQVAQELAKRGIAYCAFNYILRPKGIFPQVWWDFHNAARYLRKHAQTYHLDPLRFGAYGISAGGWVISSASMPGGDYFATSTNNGAVHIADLLKQGGKTKARGPDDEFAWLKPMRDPAPAWPGEAGGFSALAWDFAYHVASGDAASPSVQQWTGQGARPKNFDQITAAGVRLTLTEMTAPKYAGQHVHVPPFYKRGTNEASDALDLEGRPGKLLGDVMMDFFVRELTSPAARPPAPEIYPVPRIVTGPTQVSLLAPRGATIHFTLDGSEPTTASPIYQTPFTITPGTTVKAISAAPGMTPSGPATARFLAGTPAPRVTGPDRLPDARTGQPYAITFSADKAKVRWQMLGDLSPYVPWQKKDLVYPNHMKLDADTGVWSGTPTMPGVYWLQVWVNEGPGMPAGYRNYRWTVTGQALDAASTEVAQSDRNQQLATLKSWPKAQAQALLDALAAARLRVVTPHAPGDAQVMLVVHADDRVAAASLVKAFVTAHAPSLASQITYHLPE